MDIIYKDDTLFVDLIGEVGTKEINLMRERVFYILDNYGIGNVVLNTKHTYKINKNMLNSFISDFHKHYDGVVMVDSK